MVGEGKAHSPDQNPIEEMSGKLEGLLRPAAARAVGAIVKCR